MLRIDVDSAPDQGKGYHVPQDNPFIGQAVWPEIYAYGFRNPWACSWDSNRLICGDVGQDLVEEIKCVLFGAPSACTNAPTPASSSPVWITAGRIGRATCRPRTTPPTPRSPVRRIGQSPLSRHSRHRVGYQFSAVEYTHDFIGGNCAVIAGHVYRGKRYPELVGTYVAADHSGILWVMPQKAGDPESFDLKFLRPLCATDSAECTTSVDNIFTIGQDRDGDLYYSTSTVRVHDNTKSLIGINIITIRVSIVW